MPIHPATSSRADLSRTIMTLREEIATVRALLADADRQIALSGQLVASANVDLRRQRTLIEASTTHLEDANADNAALRLALTTARAEIAELREGAYDVAQGRAPYSVVGSCPHPVRDVVDVKGYFDTDCLTIGERCRVCGDVSSRGVTPAEARELEDASKVGV